MMAYRSVVPGQVQESLEAAKKAWRPLYDRYNAAEAFNHAARSAEALHIYEVATEGDHDMIHQMNHIALSHVFRKGRHEKRFPEDFHRFRRIKRGFDTFNRLRANDLNRADPYEYAKILEKPCLGLIVRMVDLVQYGGNSEKSEAELAHLDPEIFYVFKEGKGKTEYEMIGHAAKKVYSPLADLFGYRELAGELNRLYYYHIDHSTYDAVERTLRDMEERVDRTGEVLEYVKIAIAEKLVNEDFEFDIKTRGRKHPGKVMEKAERYSRKHGTRVVDEVHKFHDLTAFTVILRKKNGNSVTQIDMDIFEQVADIVKNAVNSVKPLRPGTSGAKETDMVSRPKQNGYQSYHIDFAFEDRDLVGMEAIVRTEQMERYAEHGGAAHYLYKGGEGIARSVQSLYGNVIRALTIRPQLLTIDETSNQKRIRIYEVDEKSRQVGDALVPVVDVESTIAEALLCADVDLLGGLKPKLSYAAPIRDIDAIELVAGESNDLSPGLIRVLMQKAIYPSTTETLVEILRKISKRR